MEGVMEHRCYRLRALFCHTSNPGFQWVSGGCQKYLLEMNINLNIWHCLLFSWNNFRHILCEIRLPVVRR